MKKNRIFSVLSGAALLLAAGACSNDVLDPNKGNPNEVNPEDGVYFSVNFDLPSETGTRSYTNGDNSSNDGTEIGTAAENTVSSVAVVLASFTNQFIAYATTETIDEVGTSGRSYRVTSKVTKTALADYYNQNIEFATDQNGNHKINVYVFCNPTQSLLAALEAMTPDNAGQWFNKKGEFTERQGEGVQKDVIWNDEHFLMSNASIATRLFPSSLDEWEAFTSDTTPFNFSGMNNFGRPNEIDNLTDRGNIYVERAAARYDFRDGALDGINNEDETYNGFQAQTYHVVLDTDKNPLVDVFLGKMSMVNMNKSYYYLRRVSNDGLPFASMTDGKDNNLTICGPELPWYQDAAGKLIGTPGNYVVDAEAEWKAGSGNKAPQTGFDEKLNFPFFNETGVLDNVNEVRWDTSLMSAVLEGKKDDNSGKYKVWRYLTEGTIPDVTTQKNSVSNGIVFKGQMLPAREAKEGDDEFTAKLLNELKVVETQTEEQVAQNPLIYSYGGHLYCAWDHIRRMAIYLAMTGLEKKDGKWVISLNRSLGIYNAVFGTGGFGSINFSVEGDDEKTANFLNTEGDITIEDNLAADPTAPNSFYEAWKTAEGDNNFENQHYYDFRDAVVGKKITIYQESYDKELGGWAYYCYYYYWNRHNDNGQNGVMGPMEFAVVRNNVYKLAVTKVARLGHPRITVNDPDAPTPDTPDEKEDVYITVTCTTLPWVVRVNNIELK